MGQPGNPYHNPEFGGQPQWGQPAAADPWGQQPQPSAPASGGWPGSAPQPPGWGAPAGPPQAPYGSQDPWGAGGGWPAQGGYQPPPPPKSHTGLILGLIGGVLVLLVLLTIGGIYLMDDREKPPVADPSPASSASESPSPSPSPSGIDPASLDDEETDETPLRTSHMFPDRTFTGSNGDEYSLAGTLETDACAGVGGGVVKELMQRHDCDRMVVGVYLSSDEKLFSSLLVIPFGDADEAEAVEGEILDDKQEHINALTYYCPSDGQPGADQCKRKADNPATWYASFKTFHRYLLVSISLYTDGRRTKNLDDVNQMASDIKVHVTEAMLDD